MPIIQYTQNEDDLEITIDRSSKDNIRFTLDIRNKAYVKSALDGVYGMFKNGLSQHDIDNLITVNIVGYKKRKAELDIRYVMALHQKFPTINLLRNTHFYISNNLVTSCFEIAVNNCVKEFDDLRKELGQEFLDELEQLIYNI